MNADFYLILLSDCLLSVVLLGLFWYAAQIARGLRGIATWGAAHLAYTLGAALLDGSVQLVGSGHPVDMWLQTLIRAGGLLACGGMAGLALAVVQFVQQRSLTRVELALVPVCLAFSLVGWLWSTPGAQGAAMSAAEVLSLVLIVWHLRELSTRPDVLPARLMMVGCGLLMLLYGRDLLAALFGTYLPNAPYVQADLSIWFMLNFCMLMLTSFRVAESLRQSALLDPLTGALNRRGLNAELRERMRRLHESTGMAIIALDLDHFKSVNDTHGHGIGDIVLQQFSDTVRGSIRSEDLFARLGGEEFVIVMPDSRQGFPQRLAERIRAQIAMLECVPGVPLRVTVSIGVCLSPRKAELSLLMRIADEALYDAKHFGRNRVEVRHYMP
ncbi:GGDEF domain-containing protein [Uliginosibacterium sp. H1]|uniref:GGDEF domain-containing protein n=1 Tax=Uliginosibacterium sp. H1 TaxID=3114757 RepID=UPI002E16BE0D|nr:GGDEF domain-containing protein [Uliginosibacterium sp. H1]